MKKIDINKVAFCLYSRNWKSFTFYISCIFSLSIAALYVALKPFEISNVSLVIYGFAVICSWELSSNFPFYCISLSKNKHLNKNLGTIILAAMIIFLYCGIVSLYSTLMLFPHPSTHYILIIPIYISALGISIINFYYSYMIIKGEYPEQIRLLINIHNLTKDSKVNSKLFEKKEEEKTYKFDIYISLVSEIISAVGWLIIPVLIFFVIPLKDNQFNNPIEFFNSLPIFFKFGIFATIIWAIIWIILFLKTINTKYIFSNVGIKTNMFNIEKEIVWVDISEVIIDEDLIEIRSDKTKIKISIKKSYLSCSFWENLFVYLSKIPMEFIFISNSGWDKLTKKNNINSIKTFLGTYESRWNKIIKEESV